jgi:hypothetical protein
MGHSLLLSKITSAHPVHNECPHGTNNKSFCLSMHTGQHKSDDVNSYNLKKKKKSKVSDKKSGDWSKYCFPFLNEVKHFFKLLVMMICLCECEIVHINKVTWFQLQLLHVCFHCFDCRRGVRKGGGRLGSSRLGWLGRSSWFGCCWCCRFGCSASYSTY